MKKTKKIFAISTLLISYSTAVLADNYNIGLTAAYGRFQADGSQTKDSTVKNESGNAKFPFASIFLEYNQKLSSAGWSLGYGLDYVPFKAEIDSRTESETDKRAAYPSGTTGDKSATLDLKNHATIYIQPTYDLGNGLAIFGKLGYSQADLKISSTNAATGSTLNTKDTLKGALVGFGMQNNLSKETFVRLEANFSDYQEVSYTNSTGTLIKAEPELWSAKISIGRSF